jgi:lipopolysaccharide/colanic/teichoic acid biosynthesis glycosyltransferase
MGKIVRDGLKRAGDVTVATTLLVATLPTSIMVLIATAIAHRSNPFVVTRRAGKNGRTIGVLSIKTSNHFGRLIRAANIDQLPSLINVIGGQMSLVGPPPLPITYLARYTAEQSRRLEMRPGITGPAQLADHTAWDSRLRADIDYVDSWTMGLDLRILAATLGTMITNHTRTTTVPEFTGAPLPPPSPTACAQPQPQLAG